MYTFYQKSLFYYLKCFQRVKSFLFSPRIDKVQTISPQVPISYLFTRNKWKGFSKWKTVFWILYVLVLMVLFICLTINPNSFIINATCYQVERYSQTKM